MRVIINTSYYERKNAESIQIDRHIKKFKLLTGQHFKIIVETKLIKRHCSKAELIVLTDKSRATSVRILSYLFTLGVDRYFLQSLRLAFHLKLAVRRGILPKDASFTVWAMP